MYASGGFIEGGEVSPRLFIVEFSLGCPAPPVIASEADKAGAEEEDGGGLGDLGNVVLS